MAIDLSEYVTNPAMVRGLYTAGFPVDRLELTQVQVRRDGPTVEIRAILPRVPDHPPKRWDPTSNAAAMTLEFLGLSEFDMAGWATTVAHTSLTIERESEKTLHVVLSGPATRISLRCGWIQVASLTGYHRSPESEDPPRIGRE